MAVVGSAEAKLEEEVVVEKMHLEMELERVPWRKAAHHKALEQTA